jgi:nitrate reductase gamma subunit
MQRSENPALALGLLAFCAGVVVVLYALVLGFTIEASPQDALDSAKGQRIALPAVVAVLAGVVGLAARRRRWGVVVTAVGAVAGVVAVLLAVLLPSG